MGGPDRWPDSVYSDALEAVVGAVYLDGGLTASAKFVLDVLSEDIAKAVKQGASKDYKSLLLEFAQAGSGEQPVYEHKVLIYTCLIKATNLKLHVLYFLPASKLK